MAPFCPPRALAAGEIRLEGVSGEIDLSGSDPQTDSFVNSSHANMQAAVAMAAVVGQAFESDTVAELSQSTRRVEEPWRSAADFDYASVRGLSAEVQQKLERVRPLSIGQAQRIPGMTPAAISLLLVHLERQRRSRVA